MADIVGGTLDAAGVRTAFAESGREHDCPTVVLVHGGAWGESAATTWTPTLRALGERRHVVAYDVAGFGHSAKLRDFADPIGFMAAQLAAVVTALDVAEVDLVGLSMGGSLCLAALTAEPPLLRARSLVLVSAGGAAISPEIRARLGRFDGSHESMREQIALGFADPRWAADEAFVTERVDSALLPGAYEAFAALAIRSPRGGAPPPPPDLTRLRLPVLVVAGGRDAIKPPGWAEPFVAALPDGRLHVEPLAGHCPQIEAAESFVAAVETFLGELSPDELSWDDTAAPPSPHH